MKPQQTKESAISAETKSPEEKLAQGSRELISDFLKQSDNPWQAWRLSALQRIESNYRDKAIARAEHYLLRYAVASSGLDRIAEDFRKFDKTWYHSIVRPIKCLIGMSTRDRDLKKWEQLGYQDGKVQLQAMDETKGKIKQKSEDDAKQFMLDVTNEAVKLLETDNHLRSKKRLVYWWMRLLRWQQNREK